MNGFYALHGALKANDLTIQDVADELGRSLTYVNVRMAGKESFTLDEAYAILDMVGADESEIYWYFPKDKKGRKPNDRSTKRVRTGDAGRRYVAAPIRLPGR